MSNVVNYIEQGGALSVIGGELRIASGGVLSAARGNATAASGAASAEGISGKITTEALTTAAGAAYTLTLTNTVIAATDIVLVSVANGSNTQGVVVAGLVTPAAGSCTIVVRNEHASQALNGTLVIAFLVVKAA